MSSLVVTFVLSFYVFGFMFVCTGRLFYLNWCQTHHTWLLMWGNLVQCKH